MTGTDAQSEAAARARMDALRRALAATADAPGRARLRVRLADVLAAHGDGTAACRELQQAAAEAPASPGLLFAARALAGRLAPDEARALLAAVQAARPAPAAVVTAKPAGPGGAAGPGPNPAPDRAPAAAPPAGRGTAAATGAAPRGPATMTPPPFETAAPAPARPVRAPDPVAAAFAALVEGKAVRARRLGEEASRLSGARESARLGDLVIALREHGASRQALLLARTLAEESGVGGDGAGAVAALVAEADAAGARDLADRWRVDVGQASAARNGETAAPASAPAPAPARRDDPALLRAAYHRERQPQRRARLAARLAAALRDRGDAPAAVLALEAALIDLPSSVELTPLRRLRADLLRAAGNVTDLAAALEVDAAAADAVPDRVAALAERAQILEGLGELEQALEGRLEALELSPGDGPLLEAARRRLEATGRLDRSLELAVAALRRVRERAARARLLRDVATLAEASAGDQRRAATAWMEVLSLLPHDTAATEAAERLLREVGDWERLGELLGWSAARVVDPEARAAALWKLAEVRRTHLGQPDAALAIYREIAGARRAAGDPPALPMPADDWQRRDDALAFHSARALAAPTPPTRAEALVARAVVLLESDRLDEADRDLSRALDLDPANGDAVAAFERIYERRGDFRSLRQRLQTRAAAAPPAVAVHLLLGIGRASERLGDLAAARLAYERALAADESARPALIALRQLALGRSDFQEAVRLLEREAPLVRAPEERAALLIELGALLADKLARGARAIEVLESALAFQPGNAVALEALYRVALGAGSWEKANQALEAMLSSGTALTDAAERYHRLGRAAEAAGQPDRALGLYSRSYARDPAFRPTLEQLSEICFDRQQWENAWKATEHLIARHGADFPPPERAALSLRSALADLHVAQRNAAVVRLGSLLPGPRENEGTAGARDVAESWASMRFEPRLLGGVDNERRARALGRLAEVLSLTEAIPEDASRAGARETLAALALCDRRWADAVSLLDGLGSEPSLDARRRCLFLCAAGDVVLFHQRDAAGAAARYRRARALNPHEPRLGRPSVTQLTTDPTGSIEL